MPLNTESSFFSQGPVKVTTLVEPVGGLLPLQSRDVVYNPSNITGLTQPTVENKLRGLGLFLRDFGGGVLTENNSPAFAKAIAEYQRFDDDGSGGCTIWLDKLEGIGNWQIADPIVMPRALTIRSVDGVNACVIKPVAKVWTQPAIQVTSVQTRLIDLQLECFTMAAGSAPGINVPSGTELNLTNVSVVTGPAVGMQVAGTVNFENLSAACGAFNIPTTPNTGIIQLQDSAIFRGEGFFAPNLGSLIHQVAAIRATGARYIYVEGPVVLDGMEHLFEAATGGAAVIRSVHFPDGFLARNGPANGSYVIELRPENSSRIQDVFIGPSRTEAGFGGAVRSHGWGFMDTLVVDRPYVVGHSEWGVNAINGGVVEVRSPMITGGVGGIRLGGNTPSGTNRPLDRGAVIGGRVGPMGASPGNTGTALSVATQAHGTIHLDGVDLRGNTTDYTNPNTAVQQSVNVFTSAGRVTA